MAEKDFIGFAVVSAALFPLKGEVPNHKGIFDETLSCFSPLPPGMGSFPAESHSCFLRIPYPSHPVPLNSRTVQTNEA